jgi:TfoX/Sxy family transcriptional regulator of competence genes
MPKPDPKAMELFEGAVPKGPDIKVKAMFGNFGVFASGKMFMGIFGDQVFVKLSAERQGAALRIPGAKPFEPMKGRTMKGYVVLPPAVWNDRRKAALWVEESRAHAKAEATAAAKKPKRK